MVGPRRCDRTVWGRLSVAWRRVRSVRPGDVAQSSRRRSPPAAPAGSAGASIWVRGGACAEAEATLRRKQPPGKLVERASEPSQSGEAPGVLQGRSPPPRHGECWLQQLCPWRSGSAPTWALPRAGPQAQTDRTLHTCGYGPRTCLHIGGDPLAWGSQKLPLKRRGQLGSAFLRTSWYQHIRADHRSCSASPSAGTALLTGVCPPSCCVFSASAVAAPSERVQSRRAQAFGAGRAGA